MTAQEFCYWLQGVLEVRDPKSLTAEEVANIKRHLNLVFYNVTNVPQVTVYPAQPGITLANWPTTIC